MKKPIKLSLVFAFVISICLSVFAGNYFSNSATLKNRAIAMQTQISFSIANIEDLKKEYEDDTMKALISNIYASVQFADDGNLNAALHDLWNALVLDSENIVGKEDDLIKALGEYNVQKIKEIAMSMRTIN